MRKAPLLAYDARGKLHIVYRPRVVGRASEASEAEYERVHWGERGRGQILDGVEARAPFRDLGVAEIITYTTRKGDPELVDWVHTFGEGARGSWIPPMVREHVCQKKSCAGSGTIRLVGGTYRVTERGIVG